MISTSALVRSFPYQVDTQSTLVRILGTGDGLFGGWGIRI
jgi:hypothetical protein